MQKTTHQPRKDYFFIKLFKKETSHIKINFSDLLYVKAAHDYVLVVTKNARYITHSTLGNMVSYIPDILIRVHRSYAVNINQIDSVDSKHAVIGFELIPIGEDFRKPLLEKLYSQS